MQSALSRIWTRVAVSIFYDDNHYTMGTSYGLYGFHIFLKGINPKVNALAWLEFELTPSEIVAHQPLHHGDFSVLCLVSLFNDTSNFLGYLMPKPSL